MKQNMSSGPKFLLDLALFKRVGLRGQECQGWP